MAAPLTIRKSNNTEPFLRLWKQSWSLCVLARFAREDASRLVIEAEHLVSTLRRSRMHLT